MHFEISIYEKELPYLKAEHLQYEVIEVIDKTIQFVRIKLEIKNNYDLVCFGLAMSKSCFEVGKGDWIKRKLHSVDHNPAIEQQIDGKMFQDHFAHERFVREELGQ